MKRIKMRNILRATLTLTLISLLPSAESLSLDVNDKPDDYCVHESFNPRCLKNEVIMMRSAIYGRMRTGRCITEEEVAAQKLLAGEVPGVLGCSADVLEVLDGLCSGYAQCETRVIDLSLQNIRPCFPGLSVYLEASFQCVSVVDEERSCAVAASQNPIHIINNSASKRICGTNLQPWIVEAPIGQKVSVTLLDFTASSSHPGPDGGSKTSCQRMYGVIVDKVGKQNTSICEGSHQREKEIHLSAGNMVQIFFNPQSWTQNNGNVSKALLRVVAVGCSDVIPSEDTWMKRNGDTIIIGCYSSRQTWQLSCRGGKWSGVLGNCSVAASRDDDSSMKSEQKPTLSESGQVLAMVAIGGFTLAICLTIVCIGAVCLRRFYSESKKKQEYKTLNYRNTASSSVHNADRQNTVANDGHGSDIQQVSTYSVYAGGDANDFTNVDRLLFQTTDDDTCPSARL